MIATTFAGLFLGWGYLQNMQLGGQGLRDAAILTRIATSVASRVAQVLPMTADPLGNCTLTIPDFASFRDFSQPVSAPKTLTLSNPAAPLGNLEILGCLVKVPPSPYVEFGTGGALATLTITLQQVGSPDQSNLFSTVSITVTATSQRGVGGAKAAHTITVNSKVMLGVARLSTYNLVLTGAPGGFSKKNPQISVAAPVPGTGPSLEIKGSVFYANNTSPLDLTKVVQTNTALTPISPITFDSNFDILGSSFYYNNATAANPGCPLGPLGTTCPLDLSLMAKTFKGGVNLNVMSQALTLPFNDPGGAGVGGGYTWIEKIDYNTGGIPTNFAMPDINAENGGSMYGVYAPGAAAAPPAGYIPPGAPAFSLGADFGYNGTSGNLTSAVVGGDVIPDGACPGANCSGIQTLDQTCVGMAGTPPAPPANEFVYLQQGRNFGIDFSGTTAHSNVGPGGNIFCGLIRAADLYIYAPAGGTMHVFGLLIVNSVKILGGGTVVFANPMDNAPLGGSPFTGTNAPTQTQAGVAADMAYLATAYGHNFFVPVFQTTVGLSATWDTYRPHGSLRKGAVPCCGSPVTIDDTVGYVCQCGNLAGTLGSCPEPPVAPGPDNTYCIATAGAPTAQMNMWYLFNATTPALPPAAPAQPGILAPLLFSRRWSSEIDETVRE